MITHGYWHPPIRRRSRDRRQASPRWRNQDGRDHRRAPRRRERSRTSKRTSGFRITSIRACRRRTTTRTKRSALLKPGVTVDAAAADIKRLQDRFAQGISQRLPAGLHRPRRLCDARLRRCASRSSAPSDRSRLLDHLRRRRCRAAHRRRKRRQPVSRAHRRATTRSRGAHRTRRWTLTSCGALPRPRAFSSVLALPICAVALGIRAAASRSRRSRRSPCRASTKSAFDCARHRVLPLVRAAVRNRVRRCSRSDRRRSTSRRYARVAAA